MKSLSYLNNFCATFQISYLDERDASIIFDKNAANDQIIVVNEGKDHIIPLGIDIMEIVQGETLNIEYTIDLTNLSDPDVVWTVPVGCSVVHTPGTKIWKLSGITTKEQWDIAKYPTIVSRYSGFGEFVYDADITYTPSGSKSWNVNLTLQEGLFLDSVFDMTSIGMARKSTPVPLDVNTILSANGVILASVNSSLTVDTLIEWIAVFPFISQFNMSINPTIYAYLSQVSPYFYDSGVSTQLTGNPVISIGNESTIYTLRIAAVYPTTIAGVQYYVHANTHISSITYGGSGGTIIYDNVNNVLTITGTESQINSYVNSLTYNHYLHRDCYYALYYKLTLENSTDILSQRVQYINPTNFNYLTDVGMNANVYSTDSSNLINLPLVASASYMAGTYTYKIYPTETYEIPTIEHLSNYGKLGALVKTYTKASIVGEGGFNTTYYAYRLSTDNYIKIYFVANNTLSGTLTQSTSHYDIKFNISATTKCATFGSDQTVIIYTRPSSTWIYANTLTFNTSGFSTSIQVFFDTSDNVYIGYYSFSTSNYNIKIYNSAGTLTGTITGVQLVDVSSAGRIIGVNTTNNNHVIYNGSTLSQTITGNYGFTAKISDDNTKLLFGNKKEYTYSGSSYTLTRTYTTPLQYYNIKKIGYGGGYFYCTGDDGDGKKDTLYLLNHSNGEIGCIGIPTDNANVFSISIVHNTDSDNIIRFRNNDDNWYIYKFSYTSGGIGTFDINTQTYTYSGTYSNINLYMNNRVMIDGYYNITCELTLPNGTIAYRNINIIGN